MNDDEHFRLLFNAYARLHLYPSLVAISKERYCMFGKKYKEELQN